MRGTDPTTAIRPYKGRHPFTDTATDFLLFSGREDQARTLADLVAAERLSVLYARSGLGKTSLINARLMKGLRDAGYFPAAVRVTQDTDKDKDPVRSVLIGLESEARRQGVEIAGGDSATLWHYFVETRFTREGKALRPVLIIDQFEELFTIVRERSSQYFDDLVNQLADLVRGRMPEKSQSDALAQLEALPEGDPRRKLLADRLYGDSAPDIRVLLSFREDFLPEMEALQNRLPGIFRNVVRIRPLSRKDAESAITRPGQQKELWGDDQTFVFDPAALNELLDFLGTQLQGKRAVPGEEIEPMHLQVICDELDRRRRNRKGASARRITVADLGGVRGMKRILGRYYSSVLKKFPLVRLGWNARRWRPSTSNLVLVNYPRRAVRTLCQGGLISSSGRRNIIMADEARLRYGVGDSDLALLVNERLVRCEPRLGSEFYELAHDSLIAPLVSARRRRRIALGAVFVLLILVPYGTLAAYAVSKVHEKAARDQEREMYFSVLSASGPSNEERQDAWKQLIREDCADLSNRRLGAIKFKDEQILNADLSWSELSGSVFDRTLFYRARFDRTNLSNASFVGARLDGSSFNGALLGHSNFRDADPNDSTFVNANLTDANLANVDFTGVDMTGATLTDADLSGSEWWLAKGWTSDQIRELEARWPHGKIVDTPRYSEGITTRESARRRAVSQEERAARMNEIAWYRAIRGVELENANDYAAEAVLILEDLLGNGGSSAKGDLKEQLWMTRDTLAYVLLQLGRNREAVEVFSQMDWPDVRQGEVHYRYALALSRTVGANAAQPYFDRAKEKGYKPTHELLLAPLQTSSAANTALR